MREASTVDYAYDQERKSLLQRIETLEKENAALRAELCLLKGVPTKSDEKDAPKIDSVIPLKDRATLLPKRLNTSFNIMFREMHSELSFVEMTHQSPGNRRRPFPCKTRIFQSI